MQKYLQFIDKIIESYWTAASRRKLIWFIFKSKIEEGKSFLLIFHSLIHLM